MWAPRSVWKVVEKKKSLAPTRVQIPYPPACSVFLHRVGYPGTHYRENSYKIERFFSSKSLHHHPHEPNSATLRMGVAVVPSSETSEKTYYPRPSSFKDTLMGLDDWLTVHRSITLVDLQLDAQNSYLFTCNTFIKILYMFRAVPSSSSGGLRRNCIYVASGIVTVCR